MKDRFAVPIIERGLAARGKAAIQSGQKHILAAREPLVAFWGMLVDGLHHLQFMGKIPKSSHSAKLHDICLDGLSVLFLKPSQEVVGSAEMHEHDGAWLAVYASRLHDLPVCMPAGCFFLDGGHGISVYIWQDMSRDFLKKYLGRDKLLNNWAFALYSCYESIPFAKR